MAGTKVAHREGVVVVVSGRRVIAGVSGSLRSLGALRAGVAEARSTDATLVAVLAWAPAGGELAYRRYPQRRDGTHHGGAGPAGPITGRMGRQAR